MASKNVIELNADSFSKTISGDQPVLVDFWAPWCGPCRALTPIVDRIADQYAGKVTVGKVNVDENQELAMKYDITTIPRLLVFKGSDRPLHQLVGLVAEAELTKLLDRALTS
jgi:thioredoxin 1